MTHPLPGNWLLPLLDDGGREDHTSLSAGGAGAESDVYDCFITDRISVGDNAIASVRPSVRPFPLYLWNRLTADSERLHASRS